MRPRTLLLSFCVCAIPFTTAAAASMQQKLFVAGTRSSEIYVIDVATHRHVQTIRTDGNPHGFAATRDGKTLWASIGFLTPGKTAVARIDAATGRILETHAVPGVDDLELVNEDRHLYIPGFGTGCYFVFDTQEKRIVARIETAGLPHNVVAPANVLYGDRKSVV